MPRGGPFTQLCQTLAASSMEVVADLHLHTTASDGDFTPSQVVAFAARQRLKAIAITDHDTLNGLAEARAVSLSHGPEVISGVEFSCRHDGKEFHLLGLFLDDTNSQLRDLLTETCRKRRDRFLAFLDQLRGRGIAISEHDQEAILMRTSAPGRRHVADLLVRAGVVRRRFEAFRNHLDSLSVPASHLIPLQDALEVIAISGGLSYLAHPPNSVGEEEFREMKRLGLDALEAHHPSAGYARTQELLAMARLLSLHVTGGSDCHGADPAGRSIGSCGLSRSSYAALQVARPT